MAGWSAVPEDLPDCVEAVKAQLEEIATMIALAKWYLNVDQEEELKVFDVGRCYRPLARPNHPIITRLDWESLGVKGTLASTWEGRRQRDDAEDSKVSSIGGFFVNTAHFGDGVTLSLGSGKVMSELLLGLSTSVNLSGLGLE